MTEESQTQILDLVALSSEVVAAYVSNNHVAVGDLPMLIARVHGALAGLEAIGNSGTDAPPADVERPTPAQIRKSVTDDAITSFIDGKRYKTLKRHLTSHGLDPRAYRTRYGLPDDYPMVAPSYAAQRSALAKSIGLGVPGARAERERGDHSEAA